ncbi:MAG: hypothetical protein ACK5WM_04385, partial [Rhodospirillales bacterium]
WELGRSTDPMTRAERVWIEQVSREAFADGAGNAWGVLMVVSCERSGPLLQIFGWERIATVGGYASTRWRLDPTDQVGELVWHAPGDARLIGVFDRTPQMPRYPTAWQAPVVTELLGLMVAAETMTVEIETARGPVGRPTFALAGLREALEQMEGGRCAPKG